MIHNPVTIRSVSIRLLSEAFQIQDNLQQKKRSVNNFNTSHYQVFAILDAVALTINWN